MSYAYSQSIPVIHARPTERAEFVRKTYLHLAGAILAFIALETAIFATFGVETVLNTMMSYMRSPWSALVVLVLFIGAGYLARMWAQSRTSPAMQYAGLGLYVVAEAIIFLPILAIAASTRFTGANLIPTAGILTLALFGGLTVAAFVTQKDFSFLAPILSIAGFMLIGVVVVAIIFGMNLGMWFSILVLGLAAASILYTTSNIIHHYSTDMYVAASLELFAAVATMFYYILRILMELRGR